MKKLYNMIILKIGVFRLNHPILFRHLCRYGLIYFLTFLVSILSAIGLIQNG